MSTYFLDGKREQKERRYGFSKAKISLAGKISIGTTQKEPGLTTERRRVLIELAQKLLDTFKLSPFEHEAPVRHGLRVAFIDNGRSWARADFEAERIVAEALRLNGAARPTWEEGQRTYTIPVENCLWCNNPIDDEDRNLRPHQRFCSVECGRTAWRSMEFKNSKNEDVVVDYAYRLFKASKIKPRPCAECGTNFQPKSAQVRFCSLICKGKAARVYIPERACHYCSTIFTPDSSNQERNSARTIVE